MAPLDVKAVHSKEDKETDAVTPPCKKKKKRKKLRMSYSEYIFKVLKKVHPTIGVSNKSLQTVNTLIGT